MGNEFENESKPSKCYTMNALITNYTFEKRVFCRLANVFKRSANINGFYSRD